MVPCVAGICWVTPSLVIVKGPGVAEKFRMTLAQVNPTVGDIAGNSAKALSAFEAGRNAGADFVGTPEMFLVGYQAQDLVTKPAFLDAARAELDVLARACSDGPALGIGAPIREDGKIFNAYFVLQNGAVKARVLKHELPNTHVFDEHRYFSAGPISGPVQVGPVRLGIPICEDAWHVPVCETLAETGAEILFVPNGSPYYRNKFDRRIQTMLNRVVETDLPMVYLNMTGGQDDQVFDGGSFVLNEGGHLAVQMPVFDDVVFNVDFSRGAAGWRAAEGEKAVHPDAWEQDYRAMVQSLRDYLGKSRISKVLLGLSGGIDSALVATIAVDAIGAANVRCVMLPSVFTAQSSLDDASEVARLLGCRLDSVSISAGQNAVLASLDPLFAGTKPGLTEENIQSRLRGLMLMALSNKFGEMLLTTGNKSEVAVGYCTIYGDMAGGYNPLKDLYKTRVFETCRWRNANHRAWMNGPADEVIPPRVIEKPPSAELRANQRDDDSLPPYPVLDTILEKLVEDEGSVADCVALGFDPATVTKVQALLYGAEWKRFQAAPGTRLSRRAFWLDRRYPIVNQWRDGH